MVLLILGLSISYHLLTNNALTDNCRFVPSGEDKKTFGQVGSAPCAKKFPNLARWYKHIASFSSAEHNAWPSAGGSEEEEKNEADDLDLFGSDDEEDAEKAKVVQERLKAYQDKKAAKVFLQCLFSTVSF